MKLVIVSSNSYITSIFAVCCLRSQKSRAAKAFETQVQSEMKCGETRSSRVYMTNVTVLIVHFIHKTSSL